MKYLSLAALFLLSLTAFSQKMTVDVNPSSAILYLDCVPVKNVKKVNLKTSSLGILGVQEGYVTKGYTFGELKKQNSETFTINLDEVSPLPSGYNSKKIEYKEMLDATGKVEKPDRNSGFYGVMVTGTALNSPQFINAITETISDYGYDIESSGNMFEDDNSTQDAEIAIGAELLYFSKDTRGDGYQVSIIIEWSIYSFAEKKIIQKIKTAGYSDSEERKFNDELVITIKNALQGLLSNSDFQKNAGK